MRGEHRFLTGECRRLHAALGWNNSVHKRNQWQGWSALYFGSLGPLTRVPQFFVPVGVPKTPGGASSDTELEAEVVAYMKEAVKEF
jgi:hypothetical protein